MKKNKKGMKKAKRRLLLLIVVFFIGLCFMGSTVFKVWIQIFNNNHTISELTMKYNNLLEEEKQLESDVNKLRDPDYMARYARERYMYTKDGEIIIKIQGDN